MNGRFRAEYLVSAGTWYAKPLVDLDATHVSLDGVNETGSGGMALNVRGSEETVLSATPALELGAQFGDPNGTPVRPYVRGGATLFDDPDFVLLASFVRRGHVPHRHFDRRCGGQSRRRPRRARQ